MADLMRPKALAVLREGRLTVLSARSDDALTPVQVVCRVTSSRPGQSPYAVDLADGRWTCTCRPGLRGEPCAHVAAAQLVTGQVPA